MDKLLSEMFREIDKAVSDKQTEIMEWTDYRARFVAIRELKDLLRKFREDIVDIKNTRPL